MMSFYCFHSETHRTVGVDIISRFFCYYSTGQTHLGPNWAECGSWTKGSCPSSRRTPAGTENRKEDILFSLTNISNHPVSSSSKYLVVVLVVLWWRALNYFLLRRSSSFTAVTQKDTSVKLTHRNADVFPCTYFPILIKITKQLWEKCSDGKRLLLKWPPSDGWGINDTAGGTGTHMGTSSQAKTFNIH